LTDAHTGAIIASRYLIKRSNTMIAIFTKYIPATSTKPARIKAYIGSGYSATVAMDYSLPYEVQHFEAVKALVEKHDFNWDLSEMRYGDAWDGRGYVFCFAESIVGK
jgi:hypothetical protein